MVKLIYSPIASLDGHVEDEQGTFDWAAPDDEVHAFVNELERPIGTYLYGRRMYETMVFWETVSGGADQPAVIRDFAEIWRAAEKTVFSRTLQTVASARTHMSAPSTPTRFGASRKPRGADITIGGAELAGQAIARAWSTSYSCSSGRSLLVAASAHCPTTSASRSRDHANRAALRECPDRRAHALRDDRVVRPVDDRSQRPVVVEKDRRTTSPELPR